MKIAICLSGQPRTMQYAAKSILNFFSGEHEYDFFCHTWDYNIWKVKRDNGVCYATIGEASPDLSDHLSLFSPKMSLIEGQDDVPIVNGYTSLLYSIMQANHLKKMYETQHNFRYDIVVKGRYDIIFPPDSTFSPEINNWNPHYLDFYTGHTGRMNYEHDRINASDVLFYGSSHGMDILADTYRYYSKILVTTRNDNHEILGPGVLLDKYGTDCNMRSYPSSLLPGEVVYRKEMIPRDPILYYETIAKFSRSFY
jgi:hypothetical protein